MPISMLHLWIHQTNKLVSIDRFQYSTNSSPVTFGSFIHFLKVSTTVPDISIVENGFILPVSECHNLVVVLVINSEEGSSFSDNYFVEH